MDMDRWKWIDGQMIDGQMDRWIDGYGQRQMDRWIDGQMDRWIMDRWIDGQMDRWIGGQMDRWMIDNIILKIACKYIVQLTHNI